MAYFGEGGTWWSVFWPFEHTEAIRQWFWATPLSLLQLKCFYSHCRYVDYWFLSSVTSLFLDACFLLLWKEEASCHLYDKCLSQQQQQGSSIGRTLMAQCLHAYSTAFWCSTWFLRRPNTEFFPWTKVLKINPSFPFWVGFVMFFLTEAWILSIMAVFLYKCLLQVITRWLCSKSLQLSVDRFFWGRDNCSFLQRKLSHRHTPPRPNH